MLYKVFTRNISGTITDHVKFSVNFFHFKSYHKNQAPGSHHTQSNIFNKSVIILTCHICIWNLNVVSFLRTFHELKNQIWVPLKFLHIKLLGKGIQEKLFSNNIVSTKPTFLGNWVIWKTQPKLEVIHG